MIHDRTGPLKIKIFRRILKILHENLKKSKLNGRIVLKIRTDPYFMKDYFIFFQNQKNFILPNNFNLTILENKTFLIHKTVTKDIYWIKTKHQVFSSRKSNFKSINFFIKILSFVPQINEECSFSPTSSCNSDTFQCFQKKAKKRKT